MTETKAVLLDIGGTLFTYDQMGDRGASTKALAERLDLDLAVLGTAMQGGMTRAAKEFFSRPFYLHSEFFAASRKYSAELLELSPEKAELFFQRDASGDPLAGFKKIHPSEGVVETLAEIKRRGLYVGAVSNSDQDMFDAMMGALDVDQYFDHQLCSEGAQSCKPDAKIFLMALEQAGCEPHEAVFVGDTPDHDIAGAEAVGMRTVLITESTGAGFDRGEAKDGQAVIHAFSELLNHL